MRINRSIMVAMATVAIAAGGWADQHAWYPLSRPDRYFAKDWQFLGCKENVIGRSEWLERSGYVCRWARRQGETGIVREELYTTEGKLDSASEEEKTTGEKFSLVFFDQGQSYYRIPLAKPRSGLPNVIEVVSHGREIARYVSTWDSFFVTGDGKVDSVPMDTRRVSGRAFVPLEEHARRADDKMIAGLRRDGVNLSKPLTVEFGFWFGGNESPPHAELLALGCRWLTTEERHGTIGPYPGHCAKTLTISSDSLTKWHRRFTQLAQKYGGRYYGWTYRPEDLSPR